MTKSAAFINKGVIIAMTLERGYYQHLAGIQFLMVIAEIIAGLRMIEVIFSIPLCFQPSYRSAPG
ncbi:MAG TPA: hypothetical protein PKV91_00625 [Bacillota bacterium]|jgi:hypothetical protein|nr:hypothetical protein [Bacillota bacterium]HOA34802.1 hypothetical protein [Bacillota bacterium]HPZ10838.1 hypothetical protein [Bacillota bacterium]HQE09005.1 hypothetical protein [Bacillota bacterium]